MKYNTLEDKPSIRASSLDSWNTCERMAYARLFEEELREAGVIPAKQKRRTNYALYVGSAVHELAGIPKIDRDKRIDDWLTDAMNKAKENDEIVEEQKLVSSWEDTYAHVTRALDSLDDFEPIKQFQDPRRQDKILKEESLKLEKKNFLLTGHVDYFDKENSTLIDIKCSTATVPRRHDAQLGAYKILLEGDKELPVKKMQTFFVPIRTLNKPQQEIKVNQYQPDATVDHAMVTLKKAKRTIKIALESGGVSGNALPASPGCMLCSKKYCPAYETAFCPAYPSKENDDE